MAAVTRDARDGRWLARWRDPGGFQRKKSFDRRVDAERWLDQMRAQMHRGQYIDPRAGTVLVGDLARTWAGGLSHLKESTAATYRGIVRVHILPAFGAYADGTLGGRAGVGAARARLRVRLGRRPGGPAPRRRIGRR